VLNYSLDLTRAMCVCAAAAGAGAAGCVVLDGMMALPAFACGKIK
jgi:hypothetical protein